MILVLALLVDMYWYSFYWQVAYGLSGVFNPQPHPSSFLWEEEAPFGLDLIGLMCMVMVSKALWML